jgi:serine/threonine-protein kinase
LAHAHGQGLVHRDIKPENILLSEGRAVVADFGISRAVSEAGGAALTQTGMAVGTPAYMSPEQSAGDRRVDARSDIYSLGCVLYEMLVGQIPFPAPTAQAMMARHSVEQVPSPVVMRPAIPPDLERVVLCALAKNPADRFKTAGELAAALTALEKGQSPRVATRLPHAAGAAEGRPSRRRALMLIGGAVLLVIASALGWQLATGPLAGGPSVAQDGVTSVAVLPFENLGDDPADAYFGEGLADELIDALAGIGGVRVAARQSTRALMARSARPQAIGRELNVQNVLEGSVRKSGNQLQITARLIDAQDGFQVWSDRYERTLDNAFTIQGEIARSIVTALGRELGTTEAAGLEPLTRHPMAHDKYLWGQFNLNRRTREGAQDAVDNFTMAIGFDSLFARAYAGLADAHVALLGISSDAEPGATLASAREAAETALRLDPTLARARVSLGAVEFKAFEWRRAEAEYVRAMEANPDDPVVRQRYAELLASLGRVEDALVHARIAVERDQLSTARLQMLLDVLRAAGKNPDAIRAGQQILTLNANEAQAWLDLGLLFLVEGRSADAENALERYAELRGGDPADFRTFASAATRFAQDGTVSQLSPGPAALLAGSPVQLAVLHQLLGDGEAALSVLEQAYRENHPDLTAVGTRPELVPLHQHPRLRVILADLGLSAR